jgi:enoyl-CoA hydratase/carnithine racemase
MGFVTIHKTNALATLVLSRGKVNALNGIVVDEIRRALISLETDVETRAIVITGQGKFFSFGFDIPEFLSYTRDDFSHFLTEFTDLLT